VRKGERTEKPGYLKKLYLSAKGLVWGKRRTSVEGGGRYDTTQRGKCLQKERGGTRVPSRDDCRPIGSTLSEGSGERVRLPLIEWVCEKKK